MRRLFSRNSLCLHDRPYFIEVPRAKVMRINADIQRQRQWFIRQVAVRVAIELPCTAPMMRPDAHCVMAKNDSLLTYMNFGQ